MTNAAKIPEITVEKLVELFPKLEVIIIDQGNKDFLCLGLDNASPENVPIYARKTVFPNEMSTSLTYAFQWEQKNAPKYTTAAGHTIYTPQRDDGGFGLTLTEILAQIPTEMEGQKVFAVMLDPSSRHPTICEKYHQISATYLAH